MSERTPNRTTLAAAAALAMLLGLVVHNVAVAVENQRELPEDQTFRVSPRDIEELCSLNPKPAISHGFAHYYFFEQTVAGKALIVGPSFYDEAWLFARVSRMNVTISDTRLVIDPRKLRRLRKKMPLTRSWIAGKIDGKNHYQWLRVKVRRKTMEYVLAEVVNGRELYFIPRGIYKKVAMKPADIAALPPRLPGHEDAL